MKNDPSYYEAREADIPALCDKMAQRAESDLSYPMSDILHTWDKLAEMGISRPSRDDFLRMMENVQNDMNLPFHPEVLNSDN